MSTYDRACQLLAGKISGETAKAFVTKVAPGGAPWRAHAASTRRRWPGVNSRELLVRTGAMVASQSVVPTSTGVAVHFASPAGFHNEGTEHMTARRFELYEREVEPLIEAAIEEAWAEEDPVLATLRGHRF